MTESEVQLIHRDEHMIVVNKPAGMVVHRGWGKDDLTVADVVRDDMVHQPIYGIHRLDRGTSGILVFALDSLTARFLSEEMHKETPVKTYITLVRGPMREGSFVDHPISQRKGSNRVPAQTEFIPLAHAGRWSLVLARPHTGRLHQIRRHLKHLSQPVVGDVKYGKGDVNRFFREELGLHRLALHSCNLQINGPDGKRLNLDAPLPADLTEPLAKLGIWPLPLEALALISAGKRRPSENPDNFTNDLETGMNRVIENQHR